MFWFLLLLYVLLATVPVLTLPWTKAFYAGLMFAGLSLLAMVWLFFWSLSDACHGEACMGLPALSFFLFPGVVFNTTAAFIRRAGNLGKD